MHFPAVRLAPFCALLFCALVPARAQVAPPVSGTSVPPVFITDSTVSPAVTSGTSVPVGKTIVIPIVVSGSGPMTYTVKSSSPAIQPIVKTGYPVMNIQVAYSGTTTISGTTLYSFSGGGDGGSPYAGLLTGANGELYGTTEAGGTNNAGTIYEITTSGSLTTLYTFSGGSDGGNPYAGLVTGTDGNYYGTTAKGGTGSAGTVFQLTSSGSFSSLYSFTGGNDGGTPYGGLVAGTNGLLYGTTAGGGVSGTGTVFSITTSGSLTTLYSFTGGADGGNPDSGLVTGSSGNFYGTTSVSGSGQGTVYQLTLSGSVGTLTTLHTFSGGGDGGDPAPALAAGTNGDFYGVTETGGSGHGTIFQITASGSLTTLYTFTGGNDGGTPSAGLLQAADGNLYGTTGTGGSNNFGTVFEMTLGASGSFTTIHTFAGGSDGANPYAPLNELAGKLYGTTETDGSNSHGTVFEMEVATSAPFSGTMSFALLRDMAPATTGYIAGFAQAGYYNKLDFWRITNLGQNEFIAQGGDLTETGTGSPGFAFDDEFAPSLIFTGQGQLAMANSGINSNTYRGTNGSQFFITNSPIRSLDFNYTIFGQLIEGFDVMTKVMAVTTGTDGFTPTIPVVMNSVTVSEDNTDAILLINAAGYKAAATEITVNATDTTPKKNQAVVLSGTTSTPGLKFAVTTVDDTVSDPPIIVPEPNVFTRLHQKVKLPIKTVDIEYDYLLPGAVTLSDSASAGLALNGSTVSITPSSFSPVGSITAGLYTYAPFVSGNPEAQTAVTVDLGSGLLTAIPSLFRGTPGDSVVSSTSAATTGTGTVFGSFLDGNPVAVSGSFSATINWGDGTALASGTGVSVASSTYRRADYDVSYPAGHVYAKPGIYPLNVTVTDSNGGVLHLQNTSVVSSGPIYPFGRTFTAAKGKADNMVATFRDSTPGTTADAYQAVINWGDGSVGSGIIRGSNSTYMVYGSHQYTAGTTYPVDVTISRSGNTGCAWSIAKLTGVPTHQPPYSQSHIVAIVGNPGFGNGYLDEEVTLANSGNLPSGPITLKFYLSPTNTVPPASGAIALQVGNGYTYTALSLPPGGTMSGSVSHIFIPANAASSGKFIIMQVITSDPIANHMGYTTFFADPEPLIE